MMTGRRCMAEHERPAGRWLAAGGLSGRAAGRLRVLVSLALLALLLYHLEFGLTAAIIANAQIDLVVLVLALLFVDRLIATYRWHYLLRGLAPANSFLNLLRLSFVSSFVGSFMPGGVDVVRVYGLGRTTAGLPLALTSVLVERLQSLVALLGLMLLGVAIAPIELPSGTAVLAWLGLLLLASGVAAVMHPRGRQLVRFLRIGRWTAPLADFLARIFACLDAYRNRPMLIAYSSLVAVAFQLFRIGTVWVAARAIGLDIPFLVLMALLPVAIFVTLLPISLAGGLGVREFGFVVLLALAEVSAEHAFALALLLSFGGILTTLPGAWLYARGGISRTGTWRDGASRSCSTGRSP